MKKIIYAVVVMGYCCMAMACNRQILLLKTAQKMEGNWVNKTYLDSLKITKSPQRAYQAVKIHTLTIRKDTLMNNPTQVILSFREGDYWMLGRDSVSLFFSHVFDTELQLQTRLLSRKKMQLGKDIFVRYFVPSSSTTKEVQLVQEILFVGVYYWDGKRVEFSANGKIRGMEELGIKNYNPVINHYNTNQKLDQLWLNQRENYQKYGFQFNDNTLYIYQLKCPTNDLYCSEQAELGPLLYELKRKK
ncbi:hypothetical protein [Aureispira anguillae]|uniref:Lipoprotein n=1 Tax=Aureispira anguillae TaxID=2864201 RepID=A0A916DSB9_9BACT|nr:hypothetical protein [Aureispira anguillae]BDS11781.1 hypothetical protein AsAng_0024950 [Aureispira anguillae]